MWIHKRPEILKTGPFRSVGQMKNHKMSADMEAGVQLIKLSLGLQLPQKTVTSFPPKEALSFGKSSQKMLRSIEATCGCSPALLDWNR